MRDAMAKDQKVNDKRQEECSSPGWILPGNMCFGEVTKQQGANKGCVRKEQKVERTWYHQWSHDLAQELNHVDPWLAFLLPNAAYTQCTTSTPPRS